MGLWKFLKDKGYEHISFERVCSGALGVPLLYEYLKSIGAASEPDWLAAQLAECPDPTPVIFNAAHDPQEPAPLAAATVKLFVEILGAEAGNLALKYSPPGDFIWAEVFPLASSKNCSIRISWNLFAPRDVSGACSLKFPYMSL